MTAAACNLQRISRILRKDLYFSSNGNTCYNNFFLKGESSTFSLNFLSISTPKSSVLYVACYNLP